MEFRHLTKDLLRPKSFLLFLRGLIPFFLGQVQAIEQYLFELASDFKLTSPRHHCWILLSYFHLWFSSFDHLGLSHLDQTYFVVFQFFRHFCRARHSTSCPRQFHFILKAGASLSELCSFLPRLGHQRVRLFVVDSAWSI